MERSLFAFIWKHSKRQQLVLLGLTLISFPFLYASLELPKRIINDAIGAERDTIDVAGVSIGQVQFLMVLCFLFLAAVLVSGLMKMRINTMKGIVAERLLRRFRYTLINRMMRFPQPYFRATSQGEIVSMVTSEAEPMGGLMGDAVAQPVFQAGQMLTIVTFLFMQSVWFGLASVALIPLQAWLIPMLQRQINQLNKKRVIEVRALASEIGETAAGMADLRINGGWRFRLAEFTARLGRLFDIRFQIYQKKFFMKFLNNFITQLTPFFFYSVGGYLAIRGDITVGALVAALAAYKDLSSPWKELLTYYNQVQDMSLRWQIVTERFAPANMIAPELFEGEPATIPRLNGAIEIRDVTLRDANGNTILEDINLDIPAGARVAIQSTSATERAAFADLMTREALPMRGSVTMAGHPLNELHQSVLAARIGYAHSRPYFFDGTLGQNLTMALRARPLTVKWDPGHRDRMFNEARRAGNSLDPLDVEWLDPDLAGLTRDEDVQDWWFKLVQAMGTDEAMFRRTLRSTFDPALHRDLARAIVDLRPVVLERLRAAGLDDAVYRFDPNQFNPAVPLGGNLLFAVPTRSITQEQLAKSHDFIDLLRENGIAPQAMEIALGILQTLRQTFGSDGTDHPLFRRLNFDADTYIRLSAIAQRRQDKGPAALTSDEEALLLTMPFLLTAEQIGPEFSEAYKERILTMRLAKADVLRKAVGDLFTPVAPDVYLARLSPLENAIYGRVSMMAGARFELIENLVAEVLAENGLRQAMAAVIFDMPSGLGGASLPTAIQERAAFSRAGIKRPDILILDKALASHDAKSRSQARSRLRELMPDTTMVFMEDKFEHPEAYDLFVEIRDGRIGDMSLVGDRAAGGTGANDLRRKQRLLAETELFGGLDARNQRLLAFTAQWYKAPAGHVIFAEGQPADAVYLCLEGNAELRWHGAAEGSRPVATVQPGRLIGDLTVILGENRQMDLVAMTDVKFLRIGAEEFRAVMENDTEVAMNLVRTVARNLSGAAELLRTARIDIPEFQGPDRFPYVNSLN
ncbi:MAG: ABC transporter transmembrane domain-containing protein [Rhodobacteraceae bacterium]|nr:ABC transporter transmembrane domain-containing protein [Paracoccaceae bacterium]